MDSKNAYFFYSSAFFVIGTVAQFLLNLIYPVPLAFLDKYAPAAPAAALAGACLLVLSVLGLVAFALGVVRSRADRR